MSLEYIEEMLERAEDMHNMDSFNYWYNLREKYKREHKEKDKKENA